MKLVEITTTNGSLVSGQIYEANKSTVLIISSATGVKQSFYKNFADFIAGQGITVVTFDYSGIGLSLKEPIRQIKSSASDWGKNDLESVIKWTKQYYPEASVTLLGHSIGGQVIGLASSSSKVQKIILLSAQTGYWKFWKGFNRVKMWLNWYIIFPALIHIYGYMPSKKISRMENLPRNVAKQWSSWGRRPNYLFDEISEQDLFFKYISVKVTAISIENDFYAPKQAVDYLTAKYENADIKKVHLRPADYATNYIGHFGIFRQKFENTLWNLLLKEIER